MCKYRVSSVPHFPVFGLNTGKYGPKKTPYLDTFHAESNQNKDLALKRAAPQNAVLNRQIDSTENRKVTLDQNKEAFSATT